MDTSTAHTPAQSLRRSLDDGMVAGVAAGAARYLRMDVTLLRIALVVLTFVGGAAVPLYIAAWLLIPEEGADTSIAEDLFRSRRARRN